MLKNYSYNFFCLFLSLFSHHEDSGSLLKIQDAIFSHDRLVNFQRKHCELLRGEIHKMKSKFCGLQKELSETKEVKSQSIRKWTGNKSSAA